VVEFDPHDPATGEVRRFLTGPVGCEIMGTCAHARRS
jgi:secreted PhoX family phosphatase